MLNRLQTILLLPEEYKVLNLAESTRKALLVLLVLLLLGAGIFTDPLFLALDRFYAALFSGLGLASVLQKSQAAVSSQITMRSWPSMITYGLLYTGLSFCTLHVYFNRLRETSLTAAFYACIFILCTSLIIIGKILPDGQWAYMLCRRLIEMVISPLPVILLIAAFSTLKTKHPTSA